MRVQLASATDYEEVLQDLGGMAKPGILSERFRDKFVQDFRYLHGNATGDLATFMDYITLEYMIDNVIMIITGMMRGEELDRDELMAQCHPLGLLDLMPALTVSRSLTELYNTVLIETPLGPYFQELLSQGSEMSELNELNVEIVRMSLWKAYLEDFNRWCQEAADSATAETMGAILAFEADRRSLNIAVNAIGTNLPKETRLQLFPRLGMIHESGISERLAYADDLAQIRNLIEGSLPAFRALTDAAINAHCANPDRASLHSTGSADPPSFEALASEREMELCKDAFLHHFCLTPFYAWVRLREQERRNVVWIAECIAQGQKDNIHQYIPLF